ncbi:hypothetical protein BAE46_00470 [Glaciecola punicea]|jgi:Cu+-exporting ATPase|nr:hypothetical protein BAE46_00470 [Glaciecola punicea]
MKNHSSTGKDQLEHRLIVEGASCASCVSKIEKALSNIQGVQSAQMNFAQRTVTVVCNVADASLISSIEIAGYNAKIDTSESEEAIDEKDKVDAQYYKELMRDMSLALLLGVPLMIYGFTIGEMTVNTNTERLAWFVVGLLTLAVMVFPGRHFYVGAYHSFKNHSANMDTLIALGTGIAWLYSMMVVALPDLLPLMARHVYFEVSAMIIGLINLGLALEVKVRGKTSPKF